jgi:hypothetical protein
MIKQQVNWKLYHTPWTGIRDIKMVSALLWRELGASLSGDPVPEDGLLTLELA